MASLYAVYVKIIFNTTQRDTMKKTTINTTRGDQTDKVVNLNQVKLVIIGDKGFMVPPFNTTKGDTKHNEKQLQNSKIKQTTWMNNV